VRSVREIGDILSVLYVLLTIRRILPNAQTFFRRQNTADFIWRTSRFSVQWSRCAFLTSAVFEIDTAVLQREQHKITN
jgi:hypothetical protein